MPDQILSTPLETPISISGVVFDRHNRSLCGAGRVIRLEPKLSELLGRLAQRQGNPVLRADLIDDIWGDDGSDEALTQAVARLRRSLKDLGGDPDAIETLPKTGYRMRLPAETPEVAEAKHLALRTRPSALLTHGIAFGAGAAFMLLLALVWFAVALKPVTVERQVIQMTASDRTN